MDRKPDPLTASPRYRSFVNGRDQALEGVLGKYLRAMDLTLSALCRRVQEIATYHTAQGPMIHRKRDVLNAQIDHLFGSIQHDIAYLFHRMRITTYTLSHVAEAEAIGRALGKKQKVHCSKQILEDQVKGETPSGGSVHARVDLALHRLKAKVTTAIKCSQMLEESHTEMMERISSEFPSKRKVKVDPRVLRRSKPVRESARDPIYQLFPSTNIRRVIPPPQDDSIDMATGVIDPDAWQNVIEDYTSDVIPGPRGPFDQMVLFDVGEDGAVSFQDRYEWELEQEITQDFIEQVRAGQIDAANENGIDDFQWIAVIDSATDECCSSRDGLSSSEIESRLKDGDLDRDECDASVPPAHFRCRCVPAPLSSDLPDETPPDFGSFDDWLESKAA